MNSYENNVDVSWSWFERREKERIRYEEEMIVPEEGGKLYKELLEAFNYDDDGLYLAFNDAKKLLPYVARGDGFGAYGDIREYRDEYDKVGDMIRLTVGIPAYCTCMWILLKLHPQANTPRFRELAFTFANEFEQGCSSLGYDIVEETMDHTRYELNAEGLRFKKCQEIVRRYIREGYSIDESKAVALPEVEREEIVDDVSEVDNNVKEKLSDEREAIFNQLVSLVAKGEWVEPANVDNMTQMMKNVLGVGIQLEALDRERSEALWSMLEKGRGDRVKIVWQNMVGYFLSKGLLKGGSPALCKQFFGDESGYTNIDKGRNERSNAFAEVVPLLEKYMPKK